MQYFVEPRQTWKVRQVFFLLRGRSNSERRSNRRVSGYLNLGSCPYGCLHAVFSEEWQKLHRP